MDAARRVVVGVDGSPGSLAALPWAMHRALVRGAEVAVLAACSTVASWIPCWWFRSTAPPVAGPMTLVGSAASA